MPDVPTTAIAAALREATGRLRSAVNISGIVGETRDSLLADLDFIAGSHATLERKLEGEREYGYLLTNKLHATEDHARLSDEMVDDLRAEVERLREALEQIVARAAHNDLFPPATWMSWRRRSWIDGVMTARQVDADIAAAALNPKEAR